MFAVGDNNQRIYRADGSIAHLRTFCNVAPTLRYHYRNGMAICRLADGLMNLAHEGMVATCNYNEARYPSSVERFGALLLVDQVARAVPQLETQLLAYPNEWIGVLAPTKVDVGRIFDLLERSKVGERVQLQKFEDGYENLDHGRPIIVTTMHSAKGLEFRAVHLFALDTITKLDNHQRVAYTAVTRAKTSLALYHERAIPGYIEQGIVAATGAPAHKPAIAELFGDTRR
jgi:DNA helicase IV